MAILEEKARRIATTEINVANTFFFIFASLSSVGF
jgi:hypothetical protein